MVEAPVEADPLLPRLLPIGAVSGLARPAAMQEARWLGQSLAAPETVMEPPRDLR